MAKFLCDTDRKFDWSNVVFIIFWRCFHVYTEMGMELSMGGKDQENKVKILKK